MGHCSPTYQASTGSLFTLGNVPNRISAVYPGIFNRRVISFPGYRRSRKQLLCHGGCVDQKLWSSYTEPLLALALSTAIRYCGTTFSYTAVSILLNYSEWSCGSMTWICSRLLQWLRRLLSGWRMDWHRALCLWPGFAVRCVNSSLLYTRVWHFIYRSLVVMYVNLLLFYCHH